MDLEPIETHLRDENPTDDAIVLLVGPDGVAKLVEHAGRQMRDYSWRGQPLASISVDGTVGGWTEELLVRERLGSRSNFARAVGAVHHAGFIVLPTHDEPHFDVVLAEASSEEAARLLAVFGPAVNNPYKRRRR